MCSLLQIIHFARGASKCHVLPLSNSSEISIVTMLTPDQYQAILLSHSQRMGVCDISPTPRRGPQQPEAKPPARCFDPELISANNGHCNPSILWPAGSLIPAKAFYLAVFFVWCSVNSVIINSNSFISHPKRLMMAMSGKQPHQLQNMALKLTAEMSAHWNSAGCRGQGNNNITYPLGGMRLTPVS